MPFHLSKTLYSAVNNFEIENDVPVDEHLSVLLQQLAKRSEGEGSERRRVLSPIVNILIRRSNS